MGTQKIKNNTILNFQKFKFYKNISYFESQKKMSRFDYLLILHTEKSTASEVITGKFYEYLSSRIPIIVISNGPTEAGRLVRRHNLGYSIDYNKVSLVNFLKNWKRKKFVWKDLKKYRKIFKIL